MNHSFQIIEALAADRKLLNKFWHKLDASLPPTVFGSSAAGKKKLQQRLARQITAMQHGFALLTWHDKQAVACISAHVYDKPEALNTPVGIIYNLWVEEEFRRRGLASKLVKEAESRLRQLGALSFQVAWRNDPTAAAFWQRLGYQDYEVLAGKLS